MASFTHLFFESFTVLEKLIYVSLISSNEIVIEIVFTPFYEFEQFGLVHIVTRYRESMKSLSRQL